MASLEPRPGFNWEIVRWSMRAEDSCSYCDVQIPERQVPLRLWRKGGHMGAQFCEECQRAWWGIEGFDDEGET